MNISDFAYLMHGTTSDQRIDRAQLPRRGIHHHRGFRDTIEIGRQHRKRLYDPYQTKPKPIIKRRFRYTVPERTNVQGETRQPLDVPRPTVAKL